jgi:PST family polysaccharide transporter
MNRSQNLRQIAINVGWLSIDRVLRLGMGLVVGVWVIRYLGPKQFGILSYAGAFAGFFGVFATLGLDQIIVRDISQNADNKNEILGTAFVLKLFGGLFGMVTALIIIIIMNSGDKLTIILVGILSAGSVFLAFDVIDFWFQAKLQSKYTVLAKNGAFIATTLGRIVLILAHAPLLFFALASLAEVILGGCGLIVLYRKKVTKLHDWQFSFSRAKDFLRVGWPLILANMSISIYMKIDQVMLGNMVNKAEVGIYSAAVRFSEAWYFIPMIFSSSIYPSMAKLFQESEERFYDKLKCVIGYFFWGTLLLSIFVSAFRRQIINILFGTAYARASGVLAIHIYAGIIVATGVIFSQKFTLDGTTKISFYGTVVGAASNVILNLLLIPQYGIYGAAFATVISYTLPIIFQTIFFDKRIGLTFIQAIVYPFAKRHPEKQ